MARKDRLAYDGEFAPVNLDPEFPVSEPHRVVRTLSTSIKAHVHECFEIGYCYEGHGLFLIEDKMLHCGSGDAVAINHKEIHLLVSTPDSACRWAFVNLDPISLLASCLEAGDSLETASLAGSTFTNVVSQANHPDVCALVRDIVEELTEKREGYRHSVKALVWALMVKLHRLVDGKAPSDGQGSKGKASLERLRPALKQIASNYSKDISIGELAKLCCSSEPNFRRLFNRCLGVSPMDYLLRFRLEMAKMFLRNTDKSVLEISLKSGFPTLSNFNRQFKLHIGCSPRDWRKSDSGRRSGQSLPGVLS